jgi:hypothetical protein
MGRHIRMDLTQVGWEVDWMRLAQDRVRVSIASITLVFIVVYFVIDSEWKLLDTPSIKGGSFLDLLSD